MHDLLLAQYSEVGPSIVKAFSVAGLAIVGGYTFSYAGHVFAAIAEGTAGGQDEIVWPDEPLVDRLGKAAVLGWVVLVCASLPFIIGKIIAGQSVGTWIFTLCGFGMIFPVVVISIHSSNSMFTILNPSAIARMLKRPENLAFYYLAVAPVYALFGVGIWILIKFPFAMVPLAAIIIACSFMMATRLLGRLAQLVSRVGMKRRKKVVDEEEPEPNLGYLGDMARVAATRGENPTRRTGSYGMKGIDHSEPTGPPPTPSLKRVWVEEGADDPYILADTSAQSPQMIPKEWSEPSEYEMKLAMRNRPTPPPAHPWLSGTYTFPLDPNNWKALIWLTTGLCFTGWFLRVFV